MRAAGRRRDGEVAAAGDRGLGGRVGCAPSRTPSAASASGGSTSRTSADPLYVGRRWVHDDDRERARRQLAGAGRAAVLHGDAGRAARRHAAPPLPHRGPHAARHQRRGARRLARGRGASVDDFLLEELERSRDAHMRDIVATIQADQYRLIARDPAAARRSRAGRARARPRSACTARRSCSTRTARSCGGVLVVGPNPTFMEYVSHVLPDARRGAASTSAPSPSSSTASRLTRADPPDVAAAEGRPRLAEVVQRAAELRLAGEPAGARRAARGRASSVCEADEVARAARRGARGARLRRGGARALPDGRRCAASTRTTAQARRRRRYRDFDEVERALRRAGWLTRFLDRSGRSPSRSARPPLLDAASALAAAAEGILDDDEQRLLRTARRAAGATADLPLLDEAARAARRPPPALRARDRRRGAGPDADAAADGRAPAPAGSFTLLGDIAQATGRSPTAAGTSCCRTSAGGEARGRGAPPRLPRAARDHGARAAAARADRAGRRAAARLPHRAPSRRGSSGGRTPLARRATRRRRGSRARRACSR